MADNRRCLVVFRKKQKMTREKAKKILRSWDGVYIGYSSDEVEEAHNMAISALNQEPCEWGRMTFDATSGISVFEFSDGTIKRVKQAELERCEDTISREAVIEIINDIRDCISVEGYCAILERLKKLPSVTPSRHKALWIGIDEEPHEDYECSKCGYVCSTFSANIKPSDEYKFCPNCGARMDGGSCDDNK